MNKEMLSKQKRAISPIIATLLLILIAIAAGVVVYAYVLGFVGNSTGNTGGTKNTLSIDQLVLTHVTASAPVTVYVRNLGPTTESYNTGFNLQASSLNDILGPAVTVTITLGGTGPAASVASVALSYVSSSSISVAVTLTAACTGTSPTIALTVNGLGGTAGTLAATSCSGGVGPYSATITALSPIVSAGFAASTGSALALSVTSGTTYVFGTSVTAGTLSTNVNQVSQITLAPQTLTSNVNTNPLVAGTTYTLLVTGTDGAQTSSSGKSA
jgi:archaeal type IV pilus assembly protein PilA